MKISIIIPALNEGPCIEKTLQETQKLYPFEIIVADGGSTDGTRDLAVPYAKVISCGKGRAVQMNEGAKAASGDILLFLHADTLLPENAFSLIQKHAEKGGRSGRFRLKFDDDRLSLKVFASYTRFHCFSYGDQAYFISRDLFDRMGGYDESVPFEDIDFYKRLKKVDNPVIFKEAVITSARRFLEVGCLRQKFLNLFLVGLHYAGFDVSPLKSRVYKDVR